MGSYCQIIGGGTVGAVTAAGGRYADGTQVRELRSEFQVSVHSGALYVGAQYVFTPGTFEATSGNATPKYHTVGLMVDYNLSKRTDFYVQAAYQKVAGDMTDTVLDDAYIPGAAGVSSTLNQFAVHAAVRQQF